MQPERLINDPRDKELVIKLFLTLNPAKNLFDKSSDIYIILSAEP